MTNKTKTAFAILALVSGFAGLTQAQAGEGTVMLGGSNFADRCGTIGGDLFDTETGYGCDLGSTFVTCEFAGAYADCEWAGVQNQIKVVRLIGMLDATSLASHGSGQPAKKKGGGIEQLDLDIISND